MDTYLGHVLLACLVVAGFCRGTLVVMELPKDPMMLMSFINMKLRDFYPTLDALCDDMDVDRQELEGKMAEAGLEYNAAANKFW